MTYRYSGDLLTRIKPGVSGIVGGEPIMLISERRESKVSGALTINAECKEVQQLII